MANSALRLRRKPGMRFAGIISKQCYLELGKTTIAVWCETCLRPAEI